MTGGRSGGTPLEVCTTHPPPAAADHGIWQVELDARHAREARPFLIEVGVVLEFPAYYGRNWDAFDECFGDLLEVTTGGMGSGFGGRAGRPERTLHLVVRHADQLLVDAEPRDLGILVSELRHPRPRYSPPQLWHRYADLRVTFVCPPEAVAAFTARLRSAEAFDPEVD